MCLRQVPRVCANVTYADTVTTRHSVRIEKLVAGGDGLARMDDGRVVFAPGVLADEVVEISLSESRSDFGRGTLLSIV
ncbi:MAG: TRAM domain-containing protein, partial [Acidimicrobiaceae bacterium]